MNSLTPPRRRWMLGAGALAATVGAFALRRRGIAEAQAATPAPVFEVHYTDAQWRQRLNDAQYVVLRQEGTERPFSSKLLEEHRAGTFTCAGCALALFSSKTKYDSGTGWPSFWQPLADAVGETRDESLGMTRTEVHCRRCGGHLGHVFDDGPRPTGLRAGMNGVSLGFTPGAA